MFKFMYTDIQFKNILNGHLLDSEDRDKIDSDKYRNLLNELYTQYCNFKNNNSNILSTYDNYIDDYIVHQHQPNAEILFKEYPNGLDLLNKYRSFIDRIIYRYTEFQNLNQNKKFTKDNSGEETIVYKTEQIKSELDKITQNILIILNSIKKKASFDNDELISNINFLSDEIASFQDTFGFGHKSKQYYDVFISYILKSIENIPTSTDCEDTILELCDKLKVRREYHNPNPIAYDFSGLKVKEVYVHELEQIYNLLEGKVFQNCNYESFERLLSGLKSFEPLIFIDEPDNKAVLHDIIIELFEVPRWKIICNFILSSSTQERLDFKKLKGATKYDENRSIIKELKLLSSENPINEEKS